MRTETENSYDLTTWTSLRRSYSDRSACGEIVKLFAFRATRPELLKTASDPIGSANDSTIAAAAERASMIVLGWGTHGAYLSRDQAILQLLAAYPLYCLAHTKARQPKHPLYCSYSSPMLFKLDQ